MDKQEEIEQRAREVLAQHIRPANRGAAWNILECKDDSYWSPIVRAMIAFSRLNTPSEGMREATDFRLNLAKALFEASYGYHLVAWSDETQAFWLARAEDILFDAPSPPSASLPLGSGDGAVREALGKAVVFTAYHASDPLAIRFGFSNEVDRLAAANAIDKLLASIPSEGSN